MLEMMLAGGGPNGPEFDSSASILVAASNYNDVCYDPDTDVYVAVGNSGYMSRSTNGGATWSAAARINGYSNTLRAVAAGNGWIGAVGQDGIAHRSEDGGVNWLSYVKAGNPYFYSLIYNGVNFISGDLDGVIYIGEHGIAWTPITSGTTGQIRSLTHDPETGDVFYGASNGDTAKSIDNGVTWGTPVDSGTVNDSLVMGDGTLLSGSLAGLVRGSNNGGATWTTRSVGVQEYLGDIAYGPAGWLICEASNGSIVKPLHSSTDGVSWEDITTTIGQSLRSVIAVEVDSHYLFVGAAIGKIGYS